MGPTIYTEYNGDYLGFDQHIHNSNDDAVNMNYTKKILSMGDYGYGKYSSAFFSDLSLWDTFRTENPWLMLTQPDIVVGIIRSLQLITIQQGNIFPRITFANYDTECMVGQHGMYMCIYMKIIFVIIYHAYVYLYRSCNCS